MQLYSRLHGDGSKMTQINWSHIGDAIEFYKNHGFEYIDTPWYIDVNTIMITCPFPNSIALVDTHNSSKLGLVGSAEQGFLQLAKDGKITNKNYVSCGPCFRLEEIDATHQPQFMKVELFSLCKDEQQAHDAKRQMMYAAFKFLAIDDTCPHIIRTGDGYDIEINNIEVGSYGVRHHKDIGWWAYGTGLAEPRYAFSLQSTVAN
jgi:elongation factor P--beta-lysine ligase